MLEALMLFVGTFALVTAHLLSYGLLFIGLSYTVVYMGAIAIVFVFAVLAMDTHRASTNSGFKPLGKSTGVVVGVTVGYYMREEVYLLSFPKNSPSIQGEEVNFLGELIFNEAPLVLAMIGLILLFAIVGPIKA
jgi:NADH:ubiquinone oxidoreductase subunit 6 (subunit J)